PATREPPSGLTRDAQAAAVPRIAATVDRLRGRALGSLRPQVARGRTRAAARHLSDRSRGRRRRRGVSRGAAGRPAHVSTPTARQFTALRQEVAALRAEVAALRAAQHAVSSLDPAEVALVVVLADATGGSWFTTVQIVDSAVVHSELRQALARADVETARDL